MVEVIVIDDGKELNPRRRFRWWWILLAILLIVTVAIGGIAIWASIPAGELMPEAIAAMESDDVVTVTQRNWITFMPHSAPPSAGIIIYPGFRIRPESYAPVARQLAENGYLATIVRVPINFAILNPNAAGAVIENFSAVDIWVVGGHSLGGVAAAQYAGNHLDTVNGIVFLASYPAGDALKDTDLPILSLYATNDGVAETETVLNSRANLPDSTRFVAINGGNHSQFGYYGFQSGDNPATISYEEQTRQVVTNIIRLLDAISE